MKLLADNAEPGKREPFKEYLIKQNNKKPSNCNGNLMLDNTY